jgi:hypothetical protein
MLKFNKLFKITVDSLLLVFLLAILIYPATTFGWLRVKTTVNKQNLNVLPASTSRQELTETEKELYKKAMQDINQLIESTQTSNPDTN